MRCSTTSSMPAHVLIAQRGSDVSMLPFNQPALDLSEFAVAGREQAWFDVFAWSGRDLYRPGETVRLSALLRDQDGQPMPLSAAAKGKALQPVFVRYVQPDGKTFLETRLQPDAQGYVRHRAGDPGRRRHRPLARRVPHRSRRSKDAVQGMTLRIEEFLPERMKLDLDRAGRCSSPANRCGCRRLAPISMARRPRRTASPPSSRSRSSSIRWNSCPVISSAIRRLQLPKEAKDVIDTTLDAQRQAAAGHRAAGRSQAGQHRSRRSSPAACSRPAAAASTAASSACCGRPMRWSACARCSTTRKAPTPTPMPASNWRASAPTASRARARACA